MNDLLQSPDPELERIEALNRLGKYEQALLLCRELKQRYPHRDSYTLALAWAYHDCNQREDSIACFQELFEKELQQEIFTGFAFDELVRIYKENKRHDLLIHLCEQAVRKTQGEDYSLLGDLGDAYVRAEQWSDAIYVFEKMILLEPENPNSYCALGNAYVAIGEIEKAREAYTKASDVEPDQEENFFCRLAHVYLREGHTTAAEHILKEQLSKRESPFLYLELTDIFLSSKRVQDAEEYLGRAIDLDPTSEGIFYNRFGNSLLRLGYCELAIQYFKKAIQIEPENFFYYKNMEQAVLLLVK